MLLMRNQKVLLLDEPSAGLAPKAAKEIIARLDKIQAAFQVEMVCMVEHNLKLALKWATKIILLVQGRVVLVLRPRSSERLGGNLESAKMVLY